MVHSGLTTYTLETANAILSAPPPPLGDGIQTTRRLSLTLAKLLAKDRNERYFGAAALLEDLRSVRNEPFVLSSQSGHPFPRRPSVAVLPFLDIGPEDHTHFGAGLAEDLIDGLSKLQGLRVTAFGSALGLSARPMPPDEIGRRLNVRHVVDGRIRIVDNRVRINARLIDTADGRSLWSERYDRKLGDIFAAQDEISRAIVDQLKIELVDGTTTRAGDRHPEDPVAKELYLRGRLLWNKRTPQSLGQAMELFEQAIVAEPGYALAYSGLADALCLLGFIGRGRPHQVWPKARAAATRALKLDDELGAAHSSLGLVKAAYEWDWQGSEAEFRRAIDLAPGNANAHHLFGVTCLKALGRLEEALAETQLALELDPLSISINMGVGGIHHDLDQFDEAIAQYRKALDLAPQFVFARWNLARAYECQGAYREALDTLRRARELAPDDPILISSEIRNRAFLGERQEAERLFQQMLADREGKHIPAFGLAIAALGLGNLEQGFDYLGRACDERSVYVIWVNVAPGLRQLRSDHRFQAIVRRLGLTPAS